MKADVRKCPRCNVLVFKKDGCLHVQCTRCELDFCWSCMGNLELHSKCMRLCPELPFTLQTNIAIAILFLLHLPILLTLGPLTYTLLMTLTEGIPNLYRYFRNSRKMKCFCATLLTLILSILAVIPLALIGGALASILITVIGILPLTFWTLSYLIRVIYHYLRNISCC